MVLIQDKIRHNIIIFIVTTVGLIATEFVLMLLWFTVLGPGLTMANTSAVTIDKLYVPVGFTIFLAFIAGVILRGLEKKSHGLDLYNMDIAEIEIEIGLLEKEKRKREAKIEEEEQAKKDAKQFGNKAK